MTDNLELENTPSQEAEQMAPITVNDVLEKKIDYFSLPKDERDRLLNDYQKTIPDDSLTKKLGKKYAPPEMFGGKDRHGNAVRPKSLEEFEQDIINQIKYSKSDNDDAIKTKEELASVRKQMEEMMAIVKMQTNSQLQSEEEKVEARLQELINNGIYEKEDFSLYNQLIKRKEELGQKKSQFAPIEPKIEKATEPVRQYTQSEADAITNFRSSNQDFVETVKNNDGIIKFFDDVSITAAKNNPRLSPKEILAFAKESTEKMYPNFFTKSNNVFMNNQYSSNSSNTFQKKPEAPKIVFENLSNSDQKFIQGAARNHPGKSYQQVAEIIFNPLLKSQPKN